MRSQEVIGEPLGEVVLPDEGMGQQRRQDPVATAVDRRVQGQLLVGRDVADQAARSAGTGRRARRRSVASTSAGTSITCSSGRNGSVPSLRRLTTCRGRARRRAATDQCDRRLGVERTAALLQQRRASGQTTGRRTAPAVRSRSRSPRRPAPATTAARGPPRRGRRSSAGSTTGTTPSRRQQARAAARASSASSRTCVGQHLRQPVHTVDAHGPLPGQVVQPDVVQAPRDPAALRAIRRTAAGTRSPRCTARPRGARPRAAPG